MKYKLNKVAYFICAIILNIANIKGFSASYGSRAGAGGGGSLGDMELSPAGASFLHSLESYSKNAYIDATDHLTIGYGHLVTKPDRELAAVGIDAKSVEVGTPISKPIAQRLFLLDVKKRANIKTYIHSDLTQSQFDALTSFCFNLGYGNFSGSNTVRDINAGKIIEAADHMVTWNSKLPGLVKRHFAEVSIYTDIEFDSDWREISSHIGVRMPACDRAWATLRSDLKEEVVKLYNDYNEAR